MQCAEQGAQTPGSLRTPWEGRRVEGVESAMPTPRSCPESLAWQALVGPCNLYFLDELCVWFWDHTVETWLQREQ